MELRIKGIGVGLAPREIDVINDIPGDQWNSIKESVIDLGGTIVE